MIDDVRRWRPLAPRAPRQFELGRVVSPLYRHASGAIVLDLEELRGKQRYHVAVHELLIPHGELAQSVRARDGTRGVAALHFETAMILANGGHILGFLPTAEGVARRPADLFATYAIDSPHALIRPGTFERVGEKILRHMVPEKSAHWWHALRGDLGEQAADAIVDQIAVHQHEPHPAQSVPLREYLSIVAGISFSRPTAHQLEVSLDHAGLAGRKDFAKEWAFALELAQLDPSNRAFHASTLTEIHAIAKGRANCPARWVTVHPRPTGSLLGLFERLEACPGIRCRRLGSAAASVVRDGRA